MDSVPVTFLEDIFRVTSALARGLNTWQNLSGNVSTISEAFYANVTNLYLDIYVIDNNRIRYRIDCLLPHNEDFIPFDKNQLVQIKKYFTRFQVTVQRDNGFIRSHLPETTWDNPELLEVLQLTNQFPDVVYESKILEKDEAFQRLQERHLRPPKEFLGFAISFDFLRTQIGNGYLSILTIDYFTKSEIVRVFLTSSVPYLKLVAASNNLKTQIQRKLVIVERHVSLEDSEGLAKSDIWRAEEIGTGEERNMRVLDLKTGRGLQWKVENATEFWFV
ncbi:hypothetical protein L596_012410 [Steinernema carpocapsae]|uniref:Uncharacterized protein n=1 Tax=Steinernema carpocapsae TaxID=34508 RepID=A0A4U5NXL4_STECR|nr:hypothetical protein L596_012410 [Steinernema carpocapsae]